MRLSFEKKRAKKIVLPMVVFVWRRLPPRTVIMRVVVVVEVIVVVEERDGGKRSGKGEWMSVATFRKRHRSLVKGLAR